MALPTKKVARKPLHKRSITMEVYEREDGLWDLEAQLIDTKGYEFPLKQGGVKKIGDPLHDMRICLTLDDTYTILDVLVEYSAAPYPPCSRIADAYKQLIGLSLVQKFRYEVRSRFAGINGCTHMTELINILPTAAIQGMAARLKPKPVVPGEPAQRPHQVGGCHTMRADGEVIRDYYPQWYEGVSATK